MSAAVTEPAMLREAGAGAEEAADAWCASFPGPALLLDGAGRWITGNQAARPLGAALAVGEPAVADVVTAVLGDRRPHQQRIVIPGPHGGATFDLTLLPLESDPPRLLVLGRDATLERNLTQALLASRQLFKDLVACSADFAWETVAGGEFGFVSPRGALGYSARDLHGRQARHLLWSAPADQSCPFETRTPLDAVEITLRRKDGSRAQVEISARPVADAAGRWLGARGVCRDVTAAREREAELARAHKLLEALSRTDELTGLFNRRAFIEELETRLRHRERHGRPGCLLYLDLDNFKLVNDRFGHARGDAALQAFAAGLAAGSRAGDLVARLGGDEFVIWLEDTGEAGARSKAANLLTLAAALDAEYGVPGAPLGLSIGIADGRNHEAAEALVARADAAMYAAKRNGKGAMVVAEPAAQPAD